MPRRLIHALMLLPALAAPALAQSADELAFTDYHTAMAIDDKCFFLRAFERRRTYAVELALLERLDFHGYKNALKMSDEDYWANYNKLADPGKWRASEISCTDTQAAAPYINGLRDKVARDLYSDLIIAVQLGALTAEQTHAARLYESIMAPLYGENWQGFVQHAQNLAQAKIDKARKADVDADPYNELFGSYGLGFETEEWEEESFIPLATHYNFDATVTGTVRTVDAILFELTADEAGYRLHTERSADEDGYLTGLFDRYGVRIHDIIQDAESYKTLGGAGPIYLVLTIKDNGSMRIMTFGEQARTHMSLGSFTLALHPAALSDEQKSNYTFLRSADWWNAAKIFKAERVDETCLGGPCFALPPEVVDLLMAGSEGQHFRFFLAVEPDPPIPAPESPEIQTGYTYALFGRQAFLDSANP
jgi:hypothetical protein